VEELELLEAEDTPASGFSAPVTRGAADATDANYDHPV
jgi:hypothetical protein